MISHSFLVSNILILKCVVFYTKCVISGELYEPNWCVIGDSLSILTHKVLHSVKDYKKFIYNTKCYIFDKLYQNDTLILSVYLLYKISDWMWKYNEMATNEHYSVLLLSHALCCSFTTHRCVCNTYLKLLKLQVLLISL